MKQSDDAPSSDAILTRRWNVGVFSSRTSSARNALNAKALYEYLALPLPKTKDASMD